MGGTSTSFAVTRDNKIPGIIRDQFVCKHKPSSNFILYTVSKKILLFYQPENNTCIHMHHFKLTFAHSFGFMMHTYHSHMNSKLMVAVSPKFTVTIRKDPCTIVDPNLLQFPLTRVQNILSKICKDPWTTTDPNIPKFCKPV